MSVFRTICVYGAVALGIVLMALGGIGVFTGCKANFTLPPILGFIPFMVGWGIWSMFKSYRALEKMSGECPYCDATICCGDGAGQCSKCHGRFKVETRSDGSRVAEMLEMRAGE